jgi:aryl-alcohol dehydrogenase-like predicted oxidoreductase
MKHRNLGKSGLRVSEIGLGCNAFGGRIDTEASRKVVHAALDLGITLFDTSDLYGDDYGSPGGSEICLGQLLGDRRKDIILATKFGNERKQYDAATKGGASRRVIMMAVEASLKRLRTDWIDLYQLHKPDPLTPIDETLRALDDLVRQGKVRYIGSSNFPAWRVVEAHWTAKHANLNAFVSCQNEYSVLVRGIEHELLPAMHACGLGLLPYFPLAAGLLTGKYRRDVPFPADARLRHNKRWVSHFVNDRNWMQLERLETFCAARGCSLLQLAFGWLLARPAVASVIAGATKPEQLKLNVDSAAWTPSAEDMAEIDRLTAAA